MTSETQIAKEFAVLMGTILKKKIARNKFTTFNGNVIVVENGTASFK
jgi:hypothetical protein